MLSDLLIISDLKIIQVALEGLENILVLGEKLAKNTGALNHFTVQMEECFGLEKLESLQSHENIQIYEKAFGIIERFFETIDDDPHVAPPVQETGQGLEQFNFGDQSAHTAKYEF